MQHDLPVRASVTILADLGHPEIRARWVPEEGSQVKGSVAVRVQDETGQTLLNLFLSWEQARQLRHQLGAAVEEALIRATADQPTVLAIQTMEAAQAQPEDVTLDEAVQRG